MLMVWFVRLIRFVEYLENEHSSDLALELHKKAAEAEAQVALLQEELNQARSISLRVKKKQQQVKMPLSALGGKSGNEQP
jgi:hypothetical protein